MKRFFILFSDCGSENFEFLENACSDIDIIERGNFYMNDFATGARILDSRDELTFYATDEQETILRFRFGDKIHQLV